jgi:hypothetical protein
MPILLADVSDIGDFNMAFNTVYTGLNAIPFGFPIPI